MSSNPQALPETPGREGFASPSITIVLTTILLVFFFLGLFSIYFCWCFMDGMMASWNLRRTASSGNTLNLVGVTPARNGLDPILIELFPTFTYSQVSKEKCDLECAICLVEVADDDLLRLLTVCHHCFHRECIDLWLESHKTCPVCRQDLDLPPEELKKTNNNATFQLPDETIDHHDVDNEHAVSITINDDEEPANEEEGDNADVKGTNFELEVLSRSHTTGHSLAVGRPGSRQVHVEIVVAGTCTRRRGATLSCIAFGAVDSSSPNPKTPSRLPSMSPSSDVVGDGEKVRV